MEARTGEIEVFAGDDGTVTFEHHLGERPTTIIPSNLDDQFFLVPDPDGGDPTVDVRMAPHAFQVTGFDDTTISGIIRVRDTGEPAPLDTSMRLGWLAE